MEEIGLPPRSGGRLGLARPGVRGQGHRAWRGRFQHLPDRLPGDPHRPFVRGAVRAFHVPRNRQRRHQRGGHGKHQGAHGRDVGATPLPERVELPSHHGPLDVLGTTERGWDFRHRHAGYYAALTGHRVFKRRDHHGFRENRRRARHDVQGVDDRGERHDQRRYACHGFPKLGGTLFRLERACDCSDRLPLPVVHASSNTRVRQINVNPSPLFPTLSHEQGNVRVVRSHGRGVGVVGSRENVHRERPVPRRVLRLWHQTEHHAPAEELRVPFNRGAREHARGGRAGHGTRRGASKSRHTA